MRNVELGFVEKWDYHCAEGVKIQLFRMNKRWRRGLGLNTDVYFDTLTDNGMETKQWASHFSEISENVAICYFWKILIDINLNNQ